MSTPLTPEEVAAIADRAATPDPAEPRIVAMHQCGDCGFLSRDLSVFEAHQCPGTATPDPAEPGKPPV